MGKKDRRRRRSSSSPPRKKEEKTEKKRRKSSSERPKKEGTKVDLSDSEAPVAKLIPAAQVKAKTEAKEAETFAAQLDVPLVVSGCVNKTISEIVKGTYFRHGTNHGKPVYKKKPDDTPDDDDDLDVLIYYWDERDGEENCGWWFSPSVGGEMVWAYHPSRKATSPPPAEWNVPHDGPIDKSFTVTAAPQLAKESQRSLKKEEAKDKKDEDDDDEEEEEEEEEEEVDEEVSRPKAAPLSKDGSSDSDARARRKPKDSKDLTAEERELELQEAEDRRLMEQLRQREEARKKKAEELRMRKEQEEPDRRGDDKEDKKKKKRPEKEKKKDKEEKRKREEEERERLRKDREREEEERRRKDEERRRRKEEEDRRLKEEEDRRRKREEERREEEEREKERRRRKEEERREEEEREERRRRKEEEERRRRREEEDRRRREEEEAERRREEERRRKREEEEEEERKRRRLIEEKEEAERARRKEKEKEERQKKEEERRKHEEKMQRKLEERRRREGNDERDRDRDGRDRSDRDRSDRDVRDVRDRDRDRLGREDRREDRREREDRDRGRLEREGASGARSESQPHEKERPEDKQQKAVQAVTSCFHRMSGVNLGNFESLKADFERIMASELPYTGDKEPALREEASRVLTSAEEQVAKEKLALEEEQKRREEEEKLRLEQEAKAKRQQAANLNVLKALQKLSDATPENWAQMSHDFQEIMRTELPETGDQREALQAEADRVFNYAQQYVKQMEERQKEQAERERIRLEELKVKEQNARQVLQEVEACLCKAEEEAQKARSIAEQLYQLANGGGGSSASSGRDALVSSFPKGAEEALRMGRVCLEAGKGAQLSAEGAWKVLEGHRMALLELETLRQEMLVFVQRSEARLQACQMAAQQAVKVASESRERIQNNASPMLWDRKSGDIFRTYDQDEDGFLSRNEVMNFARMEYGFAIPAASLDRIFQQLSAPSAPGLEPTRFQQLRTSVGIARFESRVLRKAQKEAEGQDSLKVEAEYRQYLKQRKGSVSAEVESIAWTDLESKVLEVESASASFVAAAEKETQEELQKFEASLDQKLAAARSSLPSFLSQLRNLRHSTMQLIMVQAPKKSSEVQKEGTKEPKEPKEPKESEKEGGDGDGKEPHGKEAPEPKPETPSEPPSGPSGLNSENSQDSDVKELKELQGKLRELSLKLARLEARVLLAERKASEGRKVTARIAASLVEEVRVEVALKLRQCIEQLGGKAVDLFQIIAKGEDAASVEEAHAFLKENNCDMEVEKLARAFAACKEDTEKGSTKVSREEFAKIIRVVYEVKREVNLTETLAIGPAMRTLEVGEHLEVHAGPRAEPSGEGLQRLHVRVLRDGALGWATLASSEGPYLVRS